MSSGTRERGTRVEVDGLRHERLVAEVRAQEAAARADVESRLSGALASLEELRARALPPARDARVVAAALGEHAGDRGIGLGEIFSCGCSHRRCGKQLL